jgi:hypothetical protein
VERLKYSGGYLDTMKTWELAERGFVDEFKGTEKMAYGNPGYDLLLPEGMFSGREVDVKSALCSCLSMKRDYISWIFLITWKKFPDFFMFVAFDDDYARIPKHLWMIPARVVWDASHGKKRFVINETNSDLSRFKKYELDVFGLINRCKHIESGN